MKKNSFLEGTFIATLAIFITKIMGMLYVIPFYSIIGKNGSALYSYAYNIYLIFLSISSAGIPIAISKIVSEYAAKDCEEAKVRSFKIGLIITSILSIICFLILILFPEQIAHLIVGDLEGGNSIKDIKLVIIAVAFSVLIIPFLSVSKGYLQGHKYIKPTSVSQMIEQFVRILVIILGSYIVIRILKLDIPYGVGVAVLGSFIGGIVAIVYILNVIRKNKSKLSLEKSLDKDNVKDKDIFKKIVSYAIPFVFINLTVNIYNTVDMSLILRTLSKLGFSGMESEFVASAITTWGYKLNQIVSAFATGVITSLIPNLVTYYTLKDYNKTNEIINKSMQIILFVSIPAAFGLSFLAKPVWTLFYGASNLGPTIFSFSILTSILCNMYIILVQAAQSMNMYKTVYFAVFSGFFTNALLDVPLMKLFNLLNLPPYWGASFSTMLGFTISLAIILIRFKKIKEIKYRDTVIMSGKILFSTIIMIILLKLLNIFIPFNNLTRMKSLVLIILYSLVGIISYLFMTHEFKIIQLLFGDKLSKILEKFRAKKKKVKNGN